MMRKTMPALKFSLQPFIIFSMLAFATACNSNEQTKPVADSSATTLPTVDTITISKDSMIMHRSAAVLQTLKTADYTAFAAFIHPMEGVRFTPYEYIDTSGDLKFVKQVFLENIKSEKKLNWGSHDGSGDPILLSTIAYIQRFVYNADFLNAEKHSLNASLGGGNSINNIHEIYSGLDYTESYFSGFDPKFEGMDWTSLKLVFKKLGTTYYLVGVIHGQWTI